MFSKKVVLVTGGTKGIGKSIVLEYLRQEAIVLALYSIDVSAAQNIQSGLSEEEAKRFFSYKGSISDSVSLRFFFNEMKSKFGHLDILINNASINKDNLLIDMEESDWDIVINTNVKGTLNVCLLASEIMGISNERERTYIINISSISGIYGRAGQANYACSKGAIIGITKLLAKKYAERNIQVNTVIPGLINTAMVDKMSQEKINEVLNASVLKRIGTPEEVAKVVVFLTTTNCSYISGTCISIDGGFLK